MIGMTGYSFVEGEAQGWSYSIDIKGYNNRYLDLAFNLPSMLQQKEPELRSRLQDCVARGRVEVVVRLKENVRNPLQVDPDGVLQAVQTVSRIREIAGIGGAIELQHLLLFLDEMRQVPRYDVEYFWSFLAEPMETAVVRFLRSREQEGERTLNDVRAQLEVLRRGVAFIRERQGGVEAGLRQSLEKRVQELRLDLEPNRLYSEIALLVLRYGIHEELARLESHLDSFAEWLTTPGPVGKKLDFLCQEIAREVNTIASKTNLAEIQLEVVGMKDAVENIREQLRNVE